MPEAEAHEKDDPVEVDNDPTQNYDNCTERFPVRGVVALQQDEGVGEKNKRAQSTWWEGGESGGGINTMSYLSQAMTNN